MCIIHSFSEKGFEKKKFYDELVLTIKAFSISYCRHSSSVKGEHGTQEETKEGEWGQGWEKMKRLAVL